MPLPENVRGILLDIEGTTTPISFVYDVLFPYARERLDAACSRVGSDRAIARAVETLREEHAAEQGNVPEFGNGAPYAAHLMDQDRKSTGLKALQGLIWTAGYEDGTLRGQIFPDVPPALEAWKRAGVRLRIFSSGSVLAQKLLFAHTDHGDLTPHFEGYHDTTTGPKREAVAYERIAGAYGLPAGQILFMSDVVPELDAASAAGMQTALLMRPGNATATSIHHPTHVDFTSLT